MTDKKNIDKAMWLAYRLTNEARNGGGLDYGGQHIRWGLTVPTMFAVLHRTCGVPRGIELAKAIDDSMALKVMYCHDIYQPVIRLCSGMYSKGDYTATKILRDGQLKGAQKAIRTKAPWFRNCDELTEEAGSARKGKYVNNEEAICALVEIAEDLLKGYKEA
jgi:hypothetical protein